MPLRLSSLRMSWSPSIKILHPPLALAAFAIAAFTLPNPAAAQDEPACKQFDWPVNRELELFRDSDMEMVFSGATLSFLPQKGLALELQPQVTVDYVLAPGRDAKSEDSEGGLLFITNVPQAGSYQVTVSNDAWIDVIQNGKAVPLTAETIKNGCPVVYKSMRFNLEPGSLTVQISDASSRRIKLAILPVE